MSLKNALLSMEGVKIFDSQINLPENKLENTQCSCFNSTFCSAIKLSILSRKKRGLIIKTDLGQLAKRYFCSMTVVLWEAVVPINSPNLLKKWMENCLSALYLWFISGNGVNAEW